jgi:hypothetical protein
MLLWGGFGFFIFIFKKKKKKTNMDEFQPFENFYKYYMSSFLCS